jgi:ADP-ribose pyrophosphatase YjhB (NUDIX family)
MTKDHDLGSFRFCPLCGTSLVVRPESLRERLTCPACGYIYYHNPVPAAGGVIVRDGRVCLVRRAIEPRRGDWTLPAGFVEYDESPEGCAVREVAEETGLVVAIDGVLGVYAGFDDPRQRVVLVLYWTLETEVRTPIAGDDAEDVGFFAENELPPNIAFRAHRQALRDLYAHDRMRR